MIMPALCPPKQFGTVMGILKKRMGHLLWERVGLRGMLKMLVNSGCLLPPAPCARLAGRFIVVRVCVRGLGICSNFSSPIKPG